MSRSERSAAELALAPSVRAGVDRWLRLDRYRDEREALEQLVERAATGDAEALAELGDAFDGPLPIGTGGRRGLCGPGTNRMNTVVLRETAQGVADALTAEGGSRRVAVVYDTRRDSRRFAHIVADQLAANDLDVLLIDSPRPTPQLSFLVRLRDCGAGIVISASHNPPSDNGIKIYGPDGAQVLGKRDRDLMTAISAAGERELARPTEAQRDRIELVAQAALAAVDGPYLDFVRAQGVAPGDLGDAGLSVVFTPLHGVGHTSVVPVLRGRGLEVHAVERQCDPDEGRFSTVTTANPEVPESMDMARELATTHGAELVLATDPDADRLGAMVQEPGGAYAGIDGNRLGVLMLDHVLRQVELPADGWVLTTLVTSPLIAALCRAHRVDVVDDLLVGFKHHAGMLREQPERPLVFACEESHGYMRGNDVHDKDGAVAALLLTECAALARREGRNLFDNLTRVWCEHGYHRERTANLYAHGTVGRDAIAAVSKAWRADPPRAVAGLSVVGVEDRALPRDTGSATRDLPGNVLVFELEASGGLACRLVLRPSGTEPKLKLYALGRGAKTTAAELDRSIVEVDALVDRVLDDARERAEVVMREVESSGA